MFTPRYSPQARDELVAAAKYIEQSRPGYGDRFYAEIDSCVRSICEDPRRWRRLLLGYRKYLTPRFNYLIWYREERDEVNIIAVHHSSRKPGYWKERVLDEQR